MANVKASSLWKLARFLVKWSPGEPIHRPPLHLSSKTFPQNEHAKTYRTSQELCSEFVLHSGLLLVDFTHISYFIGTGSMVSWRTLGKMGKWILRHNGCDPFQNGFNCTVQTLLLYNNIIYPYIDERRNSSALAMELCVCPVLVWNITLYWPI